MPREAERPGPPHLAVGADRWSLRRGLGTRLAVRQRLPQGDDAGELQHADDPHPRKEYGQRTRLAGPEEPGPRRPRDVQVAVGEADEPPHGPGHGHHRLGVVGHAVQAVSGSLPHNGPYRVLGPPGGQKAVDAGPDQADQHDPPGSGALARTGSPSPSHPPSPSCANCCRRRGAPATRTAPRTPEPPESPGKPRPETRASQASEPVSIAILRAPEDDRGPSMAVGAPLRPSERDAHTGRYPDCRGVAGVTEGNARRR